jgi:hypothetical protein
MAGKTTTIYAVSQVFPICQNETDSVKVVESQARSSDQAAGDHCRGGELKFQGFSEGTITTTQSPAEADRAKFERTRLSYENVLVEDFYVSAPYSGVCR